MADYTPDMTFSWASPQMTTPQQPQNTTLPTWGAVGSPGDPYANYNPNAPVSLARKAVGYAGLGGLAGMYDYAAWRAEHPVAAVVLPALSVAGAIGAAYHGFKRNRGSIGWTVAWFLCGSAFPIITLPIAAFQGFAKPAR